MTRREPVLATLAVAALAVAASLAATHRMGWSYDSFVYGLVAERVLDGRGLRTPIVFLRDAQAPRPDARGDVPFTAQPPLYPLLLAAGGGASPGREGLARWLNAIAHVLSSLCVLALAWRSGPWFAAGAGAAMALSGPCLTVAVGWVLSDSLFLAAFLAALAATAHARDRDARHAHLLRLAAGLAAGLCVALRYPGLALALPLAWEAWRLSRRADGWRGLAPAAELLTPLVATGAGLLLRNLQLTGHLRGVAQHPPQRSLLSAWGTLADQLSRQLTGLSAPLSLTLVALALALPTWAFVAHRRDLARHAARLGGLDLLATAALGYALVLGWALRTEPHAEPRYVLPWLPLLLAAGALGSGLGERLHARDGRHVQGALGVILTAAVLAGPGVVTSARALPLGEQAFPYLFTETHRWLVEHLPRRTPVATNDAARLAYFGEHPALALPTRAWDPAEPVPPMQAWLPARMHETGARHLVLLVGPQGLPAQGWGEQVARLSRREPLPPFELIWSGRDGVVYRLLDQ